MHCALQMEALAHYHSFQQAYFLSIGNILTNTTIRAALFTFLLATTAAFAQQKMDDMKGMDMGNMKGMDVDKKSSASTPATHLANATVKKVDEKASTVTLAHGPVPSLNWPAMTMSFKVKDKVLLKKLSVDKSIDVQFVKEGEDYVVTSVK